MTVIEVLRSIEECAEVRVNYNFHGRKVSTTGMAGYLYGGFNYLKVVNIFSRIDNFGGKLIEIYAE